MAAHFSTFRDPSGLVRFRSCLAPYNPKDLNLDARLVTFDSTWTSSMRLLTNGVVPGSSLSTRTLTYTGFGTTPGDGTRTVRVLPLAGANGPGRPTLAWMRNNGGTLTYFAAGSALSTPGTTMSYARGYGVCAVTLVDNEIQFSPSRASMDYAYFVFGVNPTAAEAGGGNGGRIGLHPLYGRGLFFSRPGFNHLTCALDDMMLSTHRNHFQVEETGTVFPQTYGGGGEFLPTSLVSGDPFPILLSAGTLRNCGIVTLRKSYPHYPPVIAYSMGTGHQQTPSIFWLSANQLLIAGMPDGTTGIRYAVVASDPAYQPGVDTSTVCRTRFWRGQEALVSKHNISWFSAGPNDFLFRSSRISPRFADFGSILTGGISGMYGLPAGGIPPDGAGSPFGFFLVQDQGQWWCGAGFAHMQDVVTATGTYYNTRFRAAIVDRTRYWWFRDAAWTGSMFGWLAAMNLSDF